MCVFLCASNAAPHQKTPPAHRTAPYIACDQVVCDSIGLDSIACDAVELDSIVLDLIAPALIAPVRCAAQPPFQLVQLDKW